MKDLAIKDVSDTAFMVAVYRSMESERSDALFHDPLSATLAGERGRKIVESLAGGILRGRSLAIRSRIMPWMMALRTRIIDDYILSSVAQGTDAVINLGAGLDTRPYRMALPQSLHWLEVDQAHVIELKESRLSSEQPRCQLERVKLDLTDLPRRGELFAHCQARFDRVLVLTEGVVPYLPIEAVAQLADDLKSWSNFRQWIVDYFSPEALQYRKRDALAQQMANAPFLFEPEDYFGFFRTHGWSSAEVKYLWDEGRRLNRPMPLPLILKLGSALARLLMPGRLEAQRKFIGYVLFEPAR